MIAGFLVIHHTVKMIQSIGHHEVVGLKHKIISCYLVERFLGYGYFRSFTFNNKVNAAIWFKNNYIVSFRGVMHTELLFNINMGKGVVQFGI